MIVHFARLGGPYEAIDSEEYDRFAEELHAEGLVAVPKTVESTIGSMTVRQHRRRLRRDTMRAKVRAAWERAFAGHPRLLLPLVS